MPPQQRGRHGIRDLALNLTATALALFAPEAKSKTSRASKMVAIPTVIFFREPGFSRSPQVDPKVGLREPDHVGARGRVGSGFVETEVAVAPEVQDAKVSPLPARSHLDQR